MNMGVLLFFLAVGGLVSLFAWERAGWPGSVRWSAARKRRREQARLAVASADQLAAEALASVHFARWERFTSTHPLLERSAGWSDAELLACLERLFAEICREDQARGSNGRDGNIYEYHDFGLGRIHEALAARLKSM